MDIEATVTIPKFFYDIYAIAAKDLHCTVEQTLSGALQAYAQYLYKEMLANGELQEDTTEA